MFRCRWVLHWEALFSKHCLEWRSFRTHNTTVIYLCSCKCRQAAYICVVWCGVCVGRKRKNIPAFLGHLWTFFPRCHKCNQRWGLDCFIWRHPQFALCMWCSVYLLYINWVFFFCKRDGTQGERCVMEKETECTSRIMINKIGSDWPFIYWRTVNGCGEKNPNRGKTKNTELLLDEVRWHWLMP